MGKAKLFSKIRELQRLLVELVINERKLSKEILAEKIIEPLLRILGWSIDNGNLEKNHVIKHYRENISVDYVLKINKIPAAYIFIYEIGESLVLDDKVKELLVLSRSPKNIVLTDGIKWILLRLPDSIFESAVKLGEFVLEQDKQDPYDLLSNIFKLANPLVLLEDNPLWRWIREYSRRLDKSPRSRCREAITLKRYDKNKHGLPRYVIMPDGSVFALNHWNEWLVKTVKWLYKKGYLTMKDLPLKLPRGRTFILNKKPLHPNNKRFHSTTRIAKGIYLEKGVGSDGAVRRILFLFKKYGINTNNIILCF